MNVCQEFNPIRKYVQFNDWVFDSYDTISKATYKVGTKTEPHEYSFGHGSYIGAKGINQFWTEGELSLSIDVNYRLYRKEDRKYVLNFIKQNMQKHGKIWAIQDDKILWAWAYVEEFSDEYERWKDHYSFDVDFKLWEGVWHVADLTDLFLLPYDVCDFTEDYDFQEVDPCGDLDCCASCSTKYQATCPDCVNDCLDVENNACVLMGGNNRQSVLDGFLNCGKSYRIVMNCNKGASLFGDRALGNKICKDGFCKSAIAGKFYSDTYADTDLVSFTLSGHWQDPLIDINGTKLLIKGEYDGTLRMDESGNVTFQEDECCPEVEIPLNDVQWQNDFGFTVHQGMNRVTVEGSCCEMGCIYIKTDGISY